MAPIYDRRRNKGAPLTAFVARTAPLVAEVVAMVTIATARPHHEGSSSSARRPRRAPAGRKTAADEAFSRRISKPKAGVRPRRPHQSIPADAGLFLWGEARTKRDPMRLEMVRDVGRVRHMPCGGHPASSDTERARQAPESWPDREALRAPKAGRPVGPLRARIALGNWGPPRSMRQDTVRRTWRRARRPLRRPPGGQRGPKADDRPSRGPRRRGR